MALGELWLLLFLLATTGLSHSWDHCPQGKAHAANTESHAILLQVAAHPKIHEANASSESHVFPGAEVWHGALPQNGHSQVQVRHGSQTMQVGGFLIVAIVALVGLKVLFPGSIVFKVISLAGLYIVCSVTMIETNKWLMIPGHFPYPLALTTNHMVMSIFLANCLRYACPDLFPSLEKVKVTRAFILNMVLIGSTFALSIVCANGAYKYVSVPFLQCMKQGNVAIIYFFSVLVGLEALRRCSIVLLTFTLFGTLLAVHGELHFQMIGFVLQIVSSLSEACKIIMQGLLMSGSQKLDPLTMVLCMAPACLVANIVPMVVIDLVKWSDFYTQFMLHWPIILVNACLAFVLNVVVAQCIKQLSPVGYLLCGIVKDVCIIVSSSLLLGESLAAMQIVGFSIALSGVASYSLYKQNADCFEDDSVINGFSRMTKKLSERNDCIEGDIR